MKCDECVKKDVCTKKDDTKVACINFLNQKRVINTSCIPGEVVFFRAGENIKECVVTMVVLDNNTTIYCREKNMPKNEWAFSHTCIGKTVFLTEAALKKTEATGSIMKYSNSEKTAPERV